MDSPNAFQSVVWIRSEHRSVFLGWPTRAMNGAVPAPRPLGYERLRLPPQIRPQPMHPVRQNISGHSEVCGDIGITPAVYDSAFQQDAVVISQIPEDGAKPVRGIMHPGDLGHQDDTPGQAGFPGVLFLPSGRFGPRHTWKHVQAQRNASEVPKLSISSCGDAPQGGWGFLGLRSGWGWGLSALGSRRGCGSKAAHDFGSKASGTRW